MALALETVLRDAPPDLAPLKAAQVSFVGPANESLSFRKEVLRQGKSATTVAVDCYAGHTMATRIVFLFASPRPSGVSHEFSRRPIVGGPERYEPFNDGGVAPAALANFDLRPAGGSLPVSAANNPEILAWVRHRDAVGITPAVSLIALADSLPPAALTSLSKIAPISSITWTLDLTRSAIAGEWFLLRSFSERAGGGYSFQNMQVWDDQGELVLSGSQTVAIFA